MQGMIAKLESAAASRQKEKNTIPPPRAHFFLLFNFLDMRICKYIYIYTRTHARTHGRTDARTHARVRACVPCVPAGTHAGTHAGTQGTQARTHARTHARTRPPQVHTHTHIETLRPWYNAEIPELPLNR